MGGERHVNVGTGVFVLQNESTLVAMQAASFASEDDFQRRCHVNGFY